VWSISQNFLQEVWELSLKKFFMTKISLNPGDYLELEIINI